MAIILLRVFGRSRSLLEALPVHEEEQMAVLFGETTAHAPSSVQTSSVAHTVSTGAGDVVHATTNAHGGAEPETAVTDAPAKPMKPIRRNIIAWVHDIQVL